MSRITDEISDLFSTYRDDLPAEYRWEDETDRWHELVFAILFHGSDRDAATARHVVSALAELKLLDLEALAGATADKTSSSADGKSASRLVDVLITYGFDEKEAHRVVLAICQAARGIQGDSGRLQVFLRRHAERMIEELQKAAPMTALPAHTVRSIYVSWLQNALEMPVPLWNESMAEFCKECDCSIDELVAAADSIDLNVAVLDDLVRLHQGREDAKVE